MLSHSIETKVPASEHPSAGDPKRASLGKANAATGLKILMIEDDEADAYLIKLALRTNARVGEIVHVHDGVEAIAVIDGRTFRPDLALVDLHMPRKDGFSVLRELGARVQVDFPAVVLTTSRAGADRLRARKRGAVQFVTKPNTMKKMTMALDEVIACI